MADDRWDIWTRNYRANWLRNNANIPDMRIAHSLTLGQALSMMDRMFEMYGDTNLRVVPSDHNWRQGWPEVSACFAPTDITEALKNSVWLKAQNSSERV